MAVLRGGDTAQPADPKEAVDATERIEAFSSLALTDESSPSLVRGGTGARLSLAQYPVGKAGVAVALAI